MECYLQSEAYGMPHLTLAAYACIKASGVEIGALCRLVLKCVSLMQFPSKQVQLCSIHYRFPDNKTKPHNVWHNFFSKLVGDKLIVHSEAEDTLLVYLFWIWDECGLFRRQHNPALWQDIRGTIASSFFYRQYDKVVDLLGAAKANSIGSLLQHTFSELSAFVRHAAEKSDRGVVHLQGNHTAQFMRELSQQEFALLKVVNESFASH
jgi:hypothetical protein